MSSVNRLGSRLQVFEDHCILDFITLEKQGRPGAIRGYLRVKKFPEDPTLCPVSSLISYNNKVAVLAPVRETFFVSFCTPHHCVLPKTLARWTTSVLEAAGVDTAIWGAHATRSASALHHRKQMSVLQLHKLADWSCAGNVYKTFYERYL